MNKANLEKLMERYWNGETSIEEEREIKCYFKNTPQKISTTETGFFFYAIDEFQKVTVKKDKILQKNNRVTWFSFKHLAVAATFFIALLFCTVWMNKYNNDKRNLTINQEIESNLRSMSNMLDQGYKEALVTKN